MLSIAGFVCLRGVFVFCGNSDCGVEADFIVVGVSVDYWYGVWLGYYF